VARSRGTDLARNWLLAILDPRRPLAFLRLPLFAAEFVRYRRLAKPESVSWSDTYPCLTDAVRTTPFDPHYFFQAAWLARRLKADPPKLHVDIGSAVTMMGVLSGFVPSVFIDYRPLTTKLEHLYCASGNLLQLPFADGKVHSISSLHVIEHVGLGRYGDGLAASGSARAASELARVLAPGGRLFLSVPVGRRRTQFNAHRIFETDDVRAMFPNLVLVDGASVDDQSRFREGLTSLLQLDQQRYACGMFEFRKPTL
jgi:SAM-dependent methyltransferase